MDILSFGAMFRYSDVSRLNWDNIQFESYLSSFETTFEGRKNYQFRQGNKVTVATTKNIICPLQLLLQLKNIHVNATPDSPIFLNSWSPCIKISLKILFLLTYQLNMINMSVTYHFGSAKSLVFLHKQDFKSQYSSQSGRSGSASATSNADIPLHLWGRHGD